MVEQAVGAVLALAVLLDVFLTVLYARLGSGFLSYRVARWTWLLFHAVSRLFGNRRGEVLSYCGPVVLVMVVTVWALTLTVGMALVMQPGLGTSVTATSGPTSTDFVSALYAAGGSMSIVGASNFVPRTRSFELLYLLNSLIGMSVIWVTLTYLMQVYTALYQRNATGYSLHIASAATGDAAEVIARLGPEGQFSAGYTNLCEFAIQMAALAESHHFYPVLFYFRFPEPSYSVSRIALLSFDAVTLIRCGVEDAGHSWIKESVAVTQLWLACVMLTTNLAETFLPGDRPDPDAVSDEDTRERWRRRYVAALRRMRQAGIKTVSDEAAGAEAYVRLRTGWQMHIRTLAPALGYTMAEIDPAGFGMPAPAIRLPE
jgi:hypothetical protein